MTIFVVTCVIVLLLLAVTRWLAVLRGVVPLHKEAPPFSVYVSRSVRET
jgi:hypothetical protein